MQRTSQLRSSMTRSASLKSSSKAIIRSSYLPSQWIRVMRTCSDTYLTCLMSRQSRHKRNCRVASRTSSCLRLIPRRLLKAMTSNGSFKWSSGTRTTRPSSAIYFPRRKRARLFRFRALCWREGVDPQSQNRRKVSYCSERPEGKCPSFTSSKTKWNRLKNSRQARVQICGNSHLSINYSFLLFD